MKPSWDDAPPWAEWLVADIGPGGVTKWRWFEERPLVSGPYVYPLIGSRSIPAYTTNDPILEPSPQTTNPAEAGSEGQPGA